MRHLIRILDENVGVSREKGEPLVSPLTSLEGVVENVGEKDGEEKSRVGYDEGEGEAGEWADSAVGLMRVGRRSEVGESRADGRAIDAGASSGELSWVGAGERVRRKRVDLVVASSRSCRWRREADLEWTP
jgi:hypothetical protein